MVLRRLLMYLTHNEELINSLAQKFRPAARRLLEMKDETETNRRVQQWSRKKREWDEQGRSYIQQLFKQVTDSDNLKKRSRNKK
ncbi:hypothetical protein SNEBB_007976 [Seison nebaliae]|nr:hypothetical protein SNEBB_007976 [Seison nebaliae]